MLSDEGGHFGLQGVGALEEGELVLHAVEVVLRIFAFPVLITADVVPKEADGLHVGEEGSGIGQQLFLQGSEELAG